jgi:phosphoribosylpyrophosphate synthetase
MSKKNYVIVGRTSHEIAKSIVQEFGEGRLNTNGNALIEGRSKVIQARVGTYEDGEASAELFIDGKLPDHPIEQNLSMKDKRKIADKLKGSSVTIVLSASGPNTSSRALSLPILAEALKEDYGVSEITWIGPATPFLRNDRKFRKTASDGSVQHQFNAVAGKVYPRMLARSGIDRVVGFEAHSRDSVEHYISAFGKDNVTFVNMGAFFANAIRSEFRALFNSRTASPPIMVGSPDGMNKVTKDEKGRLVYDFGIERASSFARALYKGTEWACFAKQEDFRARPYMFGISKERKNSKESEITDFHGDVAGKICVVLDDIIAGGGTTLNAAEALKERGAAMVIAIATHGVLVNGALSRLLKSEALDKVMLTDTIPGVMDKLDAIGDSAKQKVVVETIAPLVTREIHRSFRNG